MKAVQPWVEDAFFAVSPKESADGGMTNLGPLWHAVSPRWGHSMHTMCSYHGMFPPKLAHYFIQRYSAPGELVLDPFSGRGTTTLQARAEGRRTIGNDLNPLAFVLTNAKAKAPKWSQVIGFVSRLERGYLQSRESDPDVPPDIRMLFHVNTLRQLLYLRNRLLKKPTETWTAEEYMVAAATAGILHGSHRADGSSAYFSISMPNTFSMAPAYVEKYIREKNLIAPDQDVFARLRDKLARLYVDALDGPQGETHRSDAVALMGGKRIPAGSVDVIITSPPYLRVVNYGTSNWIRLWWLGVDEVGRQQGSGRKSLDAELDHRHTYESYKAFMLKTLRASKRLLRKDGIAVFVIGDVATPGTRRIELARNIWDEIGPQTGLSLLETIEDSLDAQIKVSRIWGETKGQATDRDCILVLARDDGEPREPSEEIDWMEPYKDGGPDAAHQWLHERR